MKPSLKALVLIGMGLFLSSRYFSGKLPFYINERFVWLLNIDTEQLEQVVPSGSRPTWLP
jgi:hypothetical protein